MVDMLNAGFFFLTPWLTMPSPQRKGTGSFKANNDIKLLFAVANVLVQPNKFTFITALT